MWPSGSPSLPLLPVAITLKNGNVCVCVVLCMKFHGKEPNITGRRERVKVESPKGLNFGAPGMYVLFVPQNSA